MSTVPCKGVGLDGLELENELYQFMACGCNKVT